MVYFKCLGSCYNVSTPIYTTKYSIEYLSSGQTSWYRGAGSGMAWIYNIDAQNTTTATFKSYTNYYQDDMDTYVWASENNNATTIYYVISHSKFGSSTHIVYSKAATKTATQQVIGYDYSKGSYVGQVTSENFSTYPNNNYQGSYWYVYTTSTTNQGTYIDTVTSEHANTYPTNGISGSYWYVLQ